MVGRRRAVLAALGVILAVGAVVALATGLLDGRAPESAAFPSSETCAGCHPTAVREWRSSAHAFAGRNVLVHASVCGPCHAPVGTQLDPEYLFKVTSGSPPAGMPRSAEEGVTCVVCHADVHAPERHVLRMWPEWPNWRTEDVALSIEPLTAARGPFGAGTDGDPAPVANDAHESRFDAAVGASEACRPCHDVVMDKRPLSEQEGKRQPLVHLMTTYAEWAASSYPSAGRSCQSCHMPRGGAAEPAAAAPLGTRYDRDLPPRPHADHSLPGVDTAYWDPRAPVDEQARRAAEHLRTAATVSLDVPPAVRAGEPFTVTATVRNVGSGHDLLTGFGFWREGWLEVVVVDAGGRRLMASGLLDDEGWLPDEHSPAVRAEPSRYDAYLLQLRPRQVQIAGSLDGWMRSDDSVVVPEAAINRNRNGTPVLSWAGYNVAPIVGRLGGTAPTDVLEDVYVLRQTHAVLRESVPAGGAKVARYPVATGGAAPGPLVVTARLRVRALGRHMTQQQEEIAEDPPIEPVYELASARATVDLRPSR